MTFILWLIVWAVWAFEVLAIWALIAIMLAPLVGRMLAERDAQS